MLQHLPDTDEQAHGLRDAVTAWSGHIGHTEVVRDELVKLVEICEASLGKLHPRTLRSRNNLALWIGQAGDPAAARDQFAALIEDMIRANIRLQDVLNTWNNHANWVSAAEVTQ